MKALLIVDVQNDLCPGGALAVAGGDEIVPVVNGLIAAFSDAGLPVVATQDWHPVGHCSFVSSPPGHAVGGVCPFAVNEGVDVYLDESLKRFATVFPACGSSNSAIELTIPELEANCDHFQGWVDVCKIPEE